MKMDYKEHHIQQEKKSGNVFRMDTNDACIWRHSYMWEKQA